jgi:hypothetical protein
VAFPVDEVGEVVDLEFGAHPQSEPVTVIDVPRMMQAVA